ncbi:MAG TPA: DNA methyltransferase [Polyangia bacterium]|nr:DNA methyltransferase [Polyangia bacterium]
MAPRGAEGMNRPTAQRRVHQGDALPWLRAAGTLAGASVVTSLPDASELPALGVDGWRRWFDQAAVLTMQSVPDEGVAIFFQSDVKRGGLWLDKGLMVSRAAERAGMGMLFHKIVCRKPPGTLTYGRASYSHLLGFARVLRPTLRRATPDLLPDGGVQPGVKAMGVLACLDACRFVIAETTTRTILDPFCGWGTVLAVANALGLDAIGVDLSARMCKRARRLSVTIAR